jgi:hypothetical protein
MKTDQGSMYRIAFALAILYAGSLVFITAAMPIYREQVFLERGMITPGGQTAILIGFVPVLILDIISVVWVSPHVWQAQGPRAEETWLLVR